ncbi:MAG: saccharopine dehydrogenase NADP-binding domain-containing protein [Thaumarchaeota archaeon]|nr:saccharopine dehydrogenase NADP-binding domain-containing protein [Nitrososphaerota archaeon]
MKIAVLGGAGLTGRCAVRALAESQDVSEGLVADLDGAAAQSVAASVGKGKFRGARVDVRDVEETASLLQGYDVVINGVQYYFNLDVMKAALKAGVNYLDFGGLYHTTLKQLKLDGRFRSKGLLGLVGMGGMPGITNVLARHAVDGLDEVSAIHIRDGARDLTKGVPPFLVTWSLDTFLDELTMDAPVFEGGRTKSVPALSRKETVDFGKPIGRIDTYVTIHSEVATFPDSFGAKGLREVDWMEGVPGLQALKLLVDLGLASKEEIEVGGLRLSPRKFLLGLVKARGLVGFPEGVVPNDWEATQLTVEGKRERRKATRRYQFTVPPRRDWKMSCAQYGVGIPASIAARMIGRGEVTAKGVLPPEMCVDPTSFMRQLRAYGFRIRIA